MLPESDIDRPLARRAPSAYKAVEGAGNRRRGHRCLGTGRKSWAHLDLLYVKHSTGCITEINDHLFEGRYSPMWIDGKKHSRNVYAHPAECGGETEGADRGDEGRARGAEESEGKNREPPQAREGKKRKKPERTKKASKRLISRRASNT